MIDMESTMGTTDPKKAWSPGIAAVLSLIIPGTGQMYKGKIGAGFMWLLVVASSYMIFGAPGVILHLICIVSAVSFDLRKNYWIIIRFLFWGLSLLSLFISFVAFDTLVRGEDTSIEFEFSEVHKLIEDYRNKNGIYPQSVETLLKNRYGDYKYFNKSKYIIFDTSFVYKASESSYTLYLYGFNHKDDGGKGDDISYDPKWHGVIRDFQNIHRFRSYLYTSGIILAILFSVLGFWPRSRSNRRIDNKSLE